MRGAGSGSGGGRQDSHHGEAGRSRRGDGGRRRQDHLCGFRERRGGAAGAAWKDRPIAAGRYWDAGLGGFACAHARRRSDATILRPGRTGVQEAMSAAIVAYAKAHPDLPWVLGSGWPPQFFADGARPQGCRTKRRPPGASLRRSRQSVAGPGHSGWAIALIVLHGGELGSAATRALMVRKTVQDQSWPENWQQIN